MKKLIFSLLMVFAIFSLTGCDKKLSCESKLTKEKDGVAMTSTIVVSFKNDVTDKATITSVFEDEETANTYYEYMKEVSEDYKLNGNTITITKEIISEEKLNYEDAKSKFEDEGYTCR